MKHEIEKIKLANGATLVNVIVKNLPITLVSAWFNAGSRFDQPEKEGTAHLLEHLLTKRTKKYSSEIERLKDIESSGIKFNAITSYETAHYFYIQQKEETLKALDFLIDGIENYEFNEEDIKKEKEVVIAEMLENESNPREYSWNLSYQALWKNSSMGKSFFGNRESMKSINKNDLDEFIEKYYVSDNCSFVIVGDENTQKIGKYLNGKLSRIDGKIETLKENFGQTEKISIKKNDESQVIVSVAFKAISVNDEPKEIVAMDFIRDYLANKWTAKLIEQLRLEKNFTYWVDGESLNYSDTGLLRFVFACDKENVSESVRIVLAEIEKIKAEAFKDEDIEIFKKSFASSLVIKFTDPYEYLWWYGWQATVSNNEKLLNIEEYAKLIQEIKSVDMRQVALKYLVKENLSISAIGDIREESLNVEM